MYNPTACSIVVQLILNNEHPTHPPLIQHKGSWTLDSSDQKKKKHKKAERDHNLVSFEQMC